MSFHEVRFPANLSFGSVGGPERRTEVVTLANGFEERNSPWQHARRHYDAGLGLRSLDDIATLIAFFEARRGQLYGFRWKDWSDFQTGLPSREVQFDDQVLGTGDGLTRTFSLAKTYTSGSNSYLRPIAKPVAGTLRAGVDGQEMQESVDYIVDTVTGAVTFTASPPAGAQITAGFQFDVPVRFDTNRIQASMSSFRAGDVPAVPIVEIRL